MTSNLGFVQTKSSLLKEKGPENFQIITYESYKSKSKKPLGEETQMKDTVNEIKEWDMKKARHEVVKFGMSGFDLQKKQEAKIQLAIKLGAKPPKNKYKNYKLLQTEKQNEQLRQKKLLEFQQLGKNQLGKSKSQGKFFKRKKNQSGLLEKYGKPTLKEKRKTKK